MNIVITGATSFIGTGIIKRLAEENHKIWAVIRPMSVNRNKIPIHENVHIIELDMQRIVELEAYVPKPVDVFFHLAWEGVRAPYRDDPQIQNANYNAAMKAIRVCDKLGCKKFVCSGSQAEYGKMCGEITEDYPCNPNTEYGKAKYKACCDLKEYAEKHQMKFIWGRIFSIYGPGDYKESLIMSCLDKMQKNETILLTECIQEWDYLYIDEVVEIFTQFATGEYESGVYNVASGEHRGLKEYVEIMKQATGSESRLIYGGIPYPDSGMVSFVPIISKLQNVIHWKSEIAFEEGINRILKGETNEEN